MNIFKKRDNLKRFEKVTQDVDDEKKRQAEESLLKPVEIQEYQGKTPRHKSELESRTTLIVFNSQEQKDLIGNLFDIRESISGDSYITNIKLLEYFAKQVALGAMRVIDDVLTIVEPCKESTDPGDVIAPLLEKGVSTVPDKVVPKGSIFQRRKLRSEKT